MKKIYMKPEMQTVVLQHQGHLMTTSGEAQALGGPNAEKFILDPDDDLKDDDVLR
ncbi:hypothetical protein L6466_06600 [Prevotella communis]|uniref:hypothetical protein n=1 Tax=Prevotella communis TaxID=2913614 RepID=UPI001EDA4A90|nr:hypothetical protein [Prevotella communis]UKK68838.1 hypothetical protein L6464_05880 [Prevotella communis]UKK71687.1 hypothetical protein L6466_06600 [Prevotella communis]